MLATLPFLASLIFPAAAVGGYALGGWWNFSAFVLAVVLVPLAELLLGRWQHVDAIAPHDRWLLRWLSWAWPPMQLGLLGWSLSVIATDDFSTVEAIGLTLSVGVCASHLGNTLAHELVHRSAPSERLLGEALLVSVTYHHFAIEHVFGHHRRAATREDPATARFGESFYWFLPRVLIGTARSAWRLEKQRLERRGHRLFSWHNRALMGAAAEGALYLAAAVIAGGGGVLFMAGQSAYAVVHLELANYIEHYGLERRRTAAGIAERFAARHAWDSAQRLSSWLLFNLPRHADHHLRPGKRFPWLVLEEAAPRLPAGYAACSLMALVPRLWFRVMDARVRPANDAEPARSRHADYGVSRL